MDRVLYRSLVAHEVAHRVTAANFANAVVSHAERRNMGTSH